MTRRDAQGIGRMCSVLLLGAYVGVRGASAAAPTIPLIADGKSEYAIVMPADEKAGGRVEKAAKYLQNRLVEATGAELPILKESELKPGSPAVYLGRTQAAQNARLPLDKLEGWAFLKAVNGRNVFLAGRDESLGIQDRRSAEYLGTLKAVLSFLQDEVGVRFLLPGPNGIHVPKRADLRVDATLNVLHKPPFVYCTGRAQEEIYDIANNQFPSHIYKTYGGHSYYRAVPKEKYGKSNPDYFALIGGVRTSTQGHLCISNPEVQDLMLKEMEQQLDAGYQWVQLAQTDGYKECECANCRAIADDECERLLVMHRKLAEIMKERRPDKKIVILAPYGPVKRPPKTFKAFPDNVIIEMCNQQQETFDAWAHVAPGKVVYIYNWGSYHVLGYLPKRTPRFAAEQVRHFAANAVLGIYKCGFGENLGLEGPVYYVYGQMMGDPAKNPDLLADEFYRAAYGKAYVPMKKLFDSLYRRMQLYSEERRGGGLPNSPEDQISHFWPPKQLLGMVKNLELAKRLDDSPRVAARIRLVEKEIQYVQSIANVFHLYHAYQIQPNWTTFDLLAEAIEARNALVDSYYDDKGKMKRVDGWPRFLGGAAKAELKTNGRLSAPLAAPFNWNVRLLKEKKILPGTGSRTVRVPRVDGITLDGVLAEPAWQRVNPESFVEINMGDLNAPTTFKVGYDDQSLFFAFACEHASVEKMDLQALGDDGACWIQECIEIFIDPTGNRDRYCQFIFNPIPNSRFDLRRGYIQDPLHPLYNKDDRAWNGRWEYAAHVDTANKRWTAEVRIPFDTLETEPAKPGAKWCMNLGREHYAGSTFRGNKGQELSLWSPNLESRSFGAPHAFGDVVFE
ncbi:MAG: DUF4838 domain-containing protein [Kiritimatiellae bacterium]|nr:DUF4838 domain-containing protein [Kiritimatiellia bacterium]